MSRIACFFYLRFGKFKNRSNAGNTILTKPACVTQLQSKPEMFYPFFVHVQDKFPNKLCITREEANIYIFSFCEQMCNNVWIGHTYISWNIVSEIQHRTCTLLVFCHHTTRTLRFDDWYYNHLTHYLQWQELIETQYCRPMTKGRNWQFCQNLVITTSRSEVLIPIHDMCKTYEFAIPNKTRRFSNHVSRLLSWSHTFAIIVILDLKIHQSMRIHWPFFPKTWTKGHWPLDDLWPHVCWGHMCDSTQGSLCPSPMTIHQCMWIQWSILQNTTYIHIHTYTYILHTEWVIT